MTVAERERHLTCGSAINSPASYLAPNKISLCLSFATIFIHVHCNCLVLDIYIKFIGKVNGLRYGEEKTWQGCPFTRRRFVDCGGNEKSGSSLILLGFCLVLQHPLPSYPKILYSPTLLHISRKLSTTSDDAFLSVAENPLAIWCFSIHIRV